MRYTQKRPSFLEKKILDDSAGCQCREYTRMKHKRIKVGEVDGCCPIQTFMPRSKNVWQKPIRQSRPSLWGFNEWDLGLK